VYTKITGCNEESELYLKLMIGRHLSELPKVIY